MSQEPVFEILKVVSLDYYPDNNVDRYIKFENIQNHRTKLEYFGNEQRLVDFIKEYNLKIDKLIIRQLKLEKGWWYVYYKDLEEMLQ